MVNRMILALLLKIKDEVESVYNAIEAQLNSDTPECEAIRDAIDKLKSIERLVENEEALTPYMESLLEDIMIYINEIYELKDDIEKVCPELADSL